MKDIYFICVNFNNSRFTLKYIDSVRSLNTNSDFCIKIVVVDNNSESNDFEIIQNYITNIPDACLIRNPENSGYFSGLNIGLNFIKKENFLFAVVGNNDLEFEKNFLEELIKFSKNCDTKVMAIAPNIINLDGDAQNPVSIERLSPMRQLFLKIYFSNYFIGVPLYRFIGILRKMFHRTSRQQIDDQVEIYLGYGACYVLTVNYFKYFSKLDDSIFMYGEEVLISHQIRSANGVMVYVPSLVVHHAEHATAGKLKSIISYRITQSAYARYQRYL